MNSDFIRIVILFMLLCKITEIFSFAISSQNILDYCIFKKYVNEFNKSHNEYYIQSTSNNKAYDFLKLNIPLFECPDKNVERIYYFRWWTYRKHIK